MYVEKITLKRRTLRDVLMLLLMTSLAKERETAVKCVTMYVTCVILENLCNGFMKGKIVIKSFIKL